MLSPRYLAGLGDELVDIYAQLEADILQDMARRLARLGKITEATRWQAQVLAESGALKKNINKYISKYSPAIQREIKAVYSDALIKNARADNRIFEEALGHGVSEKSAQLMLTNIQKTYSDLSRLTLTTAYTSEQQFIQQANNSYMQVASGAFDYDTAMKNACNQLAADGITSVQYRNGRPVRLQIEGAVRMNILTGVNQTAANVTLNNCEELGCDLVETSAHIGARPEHEEWQGEVFSISGTNPNYRPFSVCGLGTAEGICGINCRHSYYPYFEGTEHHYTQDELDEMASETVTYNGKELTRYEGEEKLRYIERNIRQYKRRALTQEAGGVDSTQARELLGKWQATARDFTKQTGIKRDSAREFIGTIDGKQPRGITPKVASIPTAKATPATAPAPQITAPTIKNVDVNINGFTSAFTHNKINTESTAELVRYMNAQPNADNRVKELFNFMNNSNMAGNVTIRNAQSGHELAHYSNGELRLVINKLAKNDPHIIGKGGTNIHEIGHLLDTLGANSGINGQASFIKVTEAIKKTVKYTAGDIPQEIAELFDAKVKAAKSARDKLIDELNKNLAKLGEQYNNKSMSYSAYYKQYKSMRKAALLEAELLERDIYGGVEALMDIYDALSGGMYQSRRVVTFGHGLSYFSGNYAKQAAEIWANYTRLSITNPELIALLRKYEPELVDALDNNAEYILSNLRGTK